MSTPIRARALHLRPVVQPVTTAADPIPRRLACSRLLTTGGADRYLESAAPSTKRRTMRLAPTLILCAAAGLAGLPSAGAASAGTRVLINPGDLGERSRHDTFTAARSLVEQALRREKLADATMSLSTDATGDLAATRSRIPDAFVAPAHVVGSAVRYGYLPLVSLTPPVQAVLVAHRDSPVKDLASAAGKRLGLPTQDSVVTYLLRGETNAANTTLKRHFGALFESRWQEALLICLQIRRCDVIAVDRALVDQWIAAGEPLKVVMQSKSVPGLSVAVKPDTPAAAAAAALRGALLAGASEGGLGPVAALDATGFDYVSTLGYFTPRALPGATVVDAAEAARLLKDGAVYVDTRTEAEFKAGHPAGARWLPYIEKSAKEADYDASKDSFEVARLPADRDTALVLACNGAECWKSYKASRMALKAGYRKVYWFRGGLPAWRAAGLPLAADG
jgi:rhodanese-related sulfurtransferase/ABC-type phosphate/phosphonate transport system substrate-binding protein